jgi:hypothetical protein
MWLRYLLKTDVLMVDTLMGHVFLDSARGCVPHREWGLVGPLMDELKKVLDSLAIGCRATLLVTQFFPSAPRMRFMSASEMSLAASRVNMVSLQRLPMLPKLHGTVWK